MDHLYGCNDTFLRFIFIQNMLITNFFNISILFLGEDIMTLIKANGYVQGEYLLIH